METLVHYNACPVCLNGNLKRVFSAVDQTVSKKEFEILECADCRLRLTQDVPDADSIAAYYKSEEYISHTNTGKGLINQLYKMVRGITLIQKQQQIEKITGVKKGRLLDVGSGAGLFVRHMKDNGWNVTGLEPDPDARAVALKNYAVQLESTTELDHLDDESFDAITLWHVLEHVHDLHPFLNQLKRVLKPSGVIFIALPNYTSKDAAKYGPFWAAYDVPRHLYHFSPESMEVLVKNNGMSIDGYQPMWFDSFYISLLSSKYKNGSVNYLSSFLTGLKSNMAAMLDKRKCSSIIYLVKKTV